MEKLSYAQQLRFWSDHCDCRPTDETETCTDPEEEEDGRLDEVCAQCRFLDPYIKKLPPE